MIDLQYWRRVLLAGFAIQVSVVLLVTVAAAIAAGFRPLETLYNVEVQTERLDLRISTVTPFQWPFENVDLIEGVGEPLTLPEKARSVTGSLQIEPPVKVLIERVALGPVTIDIESVNGRSVGQWYVEDEPSARAGRVVQITANDLPGRAARGQRVLLTLSGSVAIGRQLGSETGATTSMLRSGKVTLLARPVFFGETFQADTSELYAGDRFAVPPAPGGGEPNALGFVVADERPALTAVYRVNGLEGHVTRPGGGVYKIAASLLSRLSHDSLLRWLVQIAVFLAGATSLVSSLLQGREAWHAGVARTRRD